MFESGFVGGSDDGIVVASGSPLLLGMPFELLFESSLSKSMVLVLEPHSYIASLHLFFSSVRLYFRYLGSSFFAQLSLAVLVRRLK